ncbi:DedA family protein [Litorivicinus lipolyticus]|jgi:membrane-associated protein|uniref:DedA family protein n=1 Tax=Litorivicinus lipolyticus TaxID=418701 RepID=UPI003B5990C3
MDSILSLIQQLGPTIYLMLFLYCALKSGALPLFAGFAAHQGALDPVWVGAAAFAGGYLGDEVRFWVARRYGNNWLADKPRLSKWVAGATLLLNRYGAAYIFIYRYPKGLRTVGAFPVGLTDIAWPHFSLLNAASAASWASIMVGIGYTFGASIERAIDNGYGAVSLVLLLVFVGSTWWVWRRLTAELAD